jgi:hypothetical protein
MQVWTLGAPTIAAEPPTLSGMTTSTVDVQWQEPPLGDHDASITGYIVHWRVLSQRSGDAVDAERARGSVEAGLTLSFTVTVSVMPRCVSCTQ